MDLKRFEIARGAMRHVRCITARHGFVAVALEPHSGSAPSETWCVAFSYLPAGKNARFVRVVTHTTDNKLVFSGTPQSLSISAENVLCVPMGTDGVRTFALAAPVEPYQSIKSSMWQHLNNIGLCTFAKWIGPVGDERALVTVTSEIFSDELRVNVHGKLGTSTVISNNLLRAEAGSILSLDAAEPGHVAFVVKRGGGFFLNVLVLEEGGGFGHRSLDLAQPKLRRDTYGLPPNLIPVSLAVGDEEVVLGFSQMDVKTLRPTWTAPGFVEGYCVKSGELKLRRLLPHSVPTAVATSGSRMLIGACSGSDAWPSSIYATSSNGNSNYTVFKGDEWNRHWLPGQFHIDKFSYSYTCTKVGISETVAVIEHVSVPTRAR